MCVCVCPLTHAALHVFPLHRLTALYRAEGAEWTELSSVSISGADLPVGEHVEAITPVTHPAAHTDASSGVSEGGSIIQQLLTQRCKENIADLLFSAAGCSHDPCINEVRWM